MGSVYLFPLLNPKGKSISTYVVLTKLSTKNFFNSKASIITQVKMPVSFPIVNANILFPFWSQKTLPVRVY